MGEDFVSKDTFDIALKSIENSSVRMEQSAKRIEDALINEIKNRTEMGQDLYKTKSDKDKCEATEKRFDKRLNITIGTFITITLFIVTAIGGAYNFIVTHITKGVEHVLR